MEQFLDQRRRQLERAHSFDAVDETGSGGHRSGSVTERGVKRSAEERRWIEEFLRQLEVERSRSNSVAAAPQPAGRRKAAGGEEDEKGKEKSEEGKEKKENERKGEEDNAVMPMIKVTAAEETT
jgi:hypothetical protein